MKAQRLTLAEVGGKPTYLDWKTRVVLYEREIVDIGVEDYRGRPVGLSWVISKIESRLHPDDGGHLPENWQYYPLGTYYGFRGQKMKDGKEFGALTEPTYFTTLEEAEAEVSRRRDAIIKDTNRDTKKRRANQRVALAARLGMKPEALAHSLRWDSWDVLVFGNRAYTLDRRNNIVDERPYL
jgi:hypothetical protein